MDQLTDELRRLDPPHPPSRVDLDAVVRRARRHRTRTRLLVAVAAVVVVAAAAVPLVVDRDRDGGAAAQPPATCEPTGAATRPPASTEAEDAARRLQAVTEGMLTPALAEPLGRALPGATLQDAISCERGMAFHADGGRFVAAVVVADAAGVSRVDAEVSKEAEPAGTGCAAGSTCERSVEADGTVVVRVTADLGGGAVRRTVDAYRRDGVHVRVSAANFETGADGAVTTTRPEPPLDMTQLVGLSRAEHLTL
ncbi:hypothetical protein ACQEVZ_14535 [Dactylosporangium sp. CA-152071]|uniref:hypothetical protein n=1 Tax=Dactylosporangium sp. CA-152071 TaxID=3239933 RepID=UPI003D8ED9F3